MNVLAGTSNPGNTNAVIPVLKELIKRKYVITGIGESDGNPPRYKSIDEYENIDGIFATIQAIGSIDDARHSVDAFVETCQLFGPQVIVTSTSRPSSKLPAEEYSIDQALIAAGGELGIPTLVVEDVWDSFDPRDGILPSAITVLDKVAKDKVEEKFSGLKKVYVTGNPANDKLANIDIEEERNRLINLFGLEDRYVIGYAGQVTPDNPTTLGWVIDNLREGDFLYFGKHPRDDREYDLSKAGNKLLSKKCVESRLQLENIGFDPLIPMFDVVVTDYSTVGITSAYLGVDVINVHAPEDEDGMEGLPHQYPLVLSGASVAAGNEEEYYKALNIELLARAHKLHEVREKHYKADGKAAKRIADLVEDMASKR